MKIGILLPSDYDLGALKLAKRLSMLIGRVHESGSRWSATIGLAEPDEVRWRAIEVHLRSRNEQTVVRHLKWQRVPVDNARRMFPTLSSELDLSGLKDVLVPRDWGWNFLDCDAAIVISDAGLGPILPLLPTLFYCRDLAARFVPEAFAPSVDDPYWERQIEAFAIWRQTSVATSDPSTVDDLSSYAGVQRKRISLIENPLSSDDEPTPVPRIRDRSTIAWFIQESALDDVIHCARGLAAYAAEGGALQPVIVRDKVMGLDDHASYPTNLPSEVAELVVGLPGRSVISEPELRRLLARTGAVWSSRLAGGAGDAVLLASQTGNMFVGPDLRTNREAMASTETRGQLYRLNDATAIADALHELEHELRGASKPGALNHVSPSSDENGAADQLAALIRRTVERPLG